MGLFRRADAAKYIPLVRPKMHQARLLDAAEMGGKNFRESMEFSHLAGKVLNAGPEANQRAIDETAPFAELLLDRLLKAPDPIGIATGKQVLFEACMGWAFARVEVKAWKHLKGFTHPAASNGLVMYYAGGERDECKASLILAIETGYYAARSSLDGVKESPEQVLAELY